VAPWVNAGPGGVIARPGGTSAFACDAATG
jgi:hypothetical protein